MNIKDQIKKKISNKKVYEIKDENKDDVNFIIYFICTIIFLLCPIIAAYVRPELFVSKDAETFVDKIDKFEVIRKEIQDVNKRVDVLQDRTWVLGVANNENSYLNKQIDKKFNHGALSAKYIEIDEKWKLNKMPEHLMMDEDYKKKLERLIDYK